MTAPNGCAGFCCILLELGNGHTLAELRVAGRYDPDKARVADMLLPLTLEQAEERGRQFGIVPDGASLTPGIERFRCHHWDETTRLCRDYDRRPGMCHKFPSGPCPYPGCEYDGSPVRVSRPSFTVPTPTSPTKKGGSQTDPDP